MSALDTALADTVGLVWRAASGTVDPWTKANLQSEESSQLVQASGTSGQYTPTSAVTQSSEDVTTVLTQSNADPSQFWSGVQSSIGQAFSLSGSLGKTMLYIGIGGLLLVVAWGSLK